MMAVMQMPRKEREREPSMTRQTFVSGLVAALVAVAATGCSKSPHSTLDGAALDGAPVDGSKISVTPLGLFCSPGVDPANALLTDFSSATYSTAKGKWGVGGNLTGTTYNRKDSGSTVTTKVEAEAFSLSGQVVPGATPESYAGGGLQFDSCVDTAIYTGVEFLLSGSNGACDVYFQLATYDEQPTYAKGGCATDCEDFPQKKVTPRSTPTTVLFAELVNTGFPASAAAMAAQIMGLRWNVQLPAGTVDAGQNPCNFNLTVDDVRFVK
jgi:hypothetical protein